jgi:hypothetical protein
MARSYKVQIDSVWLTDDGTETGKPCRITIEGINGLIVANVGNVTVSDDGTPFRETPQTPTGGGRPFAIKAAWLNSTQFDAIKAVLDAAALAGSAFQVTGTGTPGDFDVQAQVNDNPTYIAADSFSGEALRGVTINLITVSGA